MSLEQLTHKPMNTIEPIQQRWGDIRFNPDETVTKGVMAKQARFVFQKGVGHIDGSDHTVRFLETAGVGSCIVVVGHDPVSGRTAMLHADQQTSIVTGKTHFQELFGDSSITLHIIGGQTGRSESLLRKIIDKFGENPNWNCAGVEALGTHGALRQVIVDSITGKVYCLYAESKLKAKPWDWQDQPEWVSRREAIAGTMSTEVIVDYPITIDRGFTPKRQATFKDMARRARHQQIGHTNPLKRRERENYLRENPGARIEIDTHALRMAMPQIVEFKCNARSSAASGLMIKGSDIDGGLIVTEGATTAEQKMNVVQLLKEQGFAVYHPDELDQMKAEVDRAEILYRNRQLTIAQLNEVTRKYLDEEGAVIEFRSKESLENEIQPNVLSGEGKLPNTLATYLAGTDLMPD